MWGLYCASCRESLEPGPGVWSQCSGWGFWVWGHRSSRWGAGRGWALGLWEPGWPHQLGARQGQGQGLFCPSQPFGGWGAAEKG